jgi:hypothetical protein
MLDNWQRIERVVKWSGLSVNSFARAIGLSRSENLYQIKRGNNGISRELASMIATKYPSVSRAWLLAGEGDMFLDRGARRSAVPFFDVDVEKWAAEPARYNAEGNVSIPTVDDADLGAMYFGRAMGEAIPPGSVVLLRRVEPAALVPGCDYVVVAGELAMLRRVRLRAGSRTLRLLPLDAENFDEVRLDADKVEALYLVRAVVINKTT